MRWNAWTILLSLVLIGAAITSFGTAGIVLAIILLVILDFRHRTKPYRLLMFLLFIAGVGIPIGLFLPSISQPREVARRATCLYRLEALGDAIRAYRAEHGPASAGVYRR